MSHLSRTCVLSAALAIALAATGCSSDKTPTSGTPAAVGGASTGGDPVAAAKAFVEKAYAGTGVLPDTTSRPAGAGKRIAVISPGQNLETAAGPVAGTVEACTELGWTCDVLDGASNPANYARLTSQAVAAHYDGIILYGIDCPLVAAALDEARRENMKIVGAYGFDCDDPKYNGPAKFDAKLAFQPDIPGVAELSEAVGFAKGEALLARNGAGQRVIAMSDDEFRIVDYVRKGFDRALATDPTSAIVADVQFQAADLGPTLQRKVAEALLQHPDATAIAVPYGAALLLGVAGAVQQAGKAGKITVVGTEGSTPELDLMRQGLVSFVTPTPLSWAGWGAADAMNSALAGKPEAYSGIGVRLVDAQHGLPPTSGEEITGYPDFRPAYRQAWGLS